MMNMFKFDFLVWLINAKAALSIEYGYHIYLSVIRYLNKLVMMFFLINLSV